MIFFGFSRFSNPQISVNGYRTRKIPARLPDTSGYVNATKFFGKFCNFIAKKNSKILNFEKRKIRSYNRRKNFPRRFLPLRVFAFFRFRLVSHRFPAQQPPHQVWRHGAKQHQKADMQRREQQFCVARLQRAHDAARRLRRAHPAQLVGVLAAHRHTLGVQRARAEAGLEGAENFFKLL